VLFKKPHHENIMPTMKNFQGHYQLAKFWVYNVHQKQPIAQLKH
jgi:hypothetical protein